MSGSDWAVAGVSAVAAAAAIGSVIYAHSAARAAKESAASATKLADVENARWHREQRPVFTATWESNGTRGLNSSIDAGCITLHYSGPDDGVDGVRAWLPHGDWLDQVDSQYRELERPISAGYPWTMPPCTMAGGETFILVDAMPGDDEGGWWFEIRVDLKVPMFFVH